MNALAALKLASVALVAGIVGTLGRSGGRKGSNSEGGESGEFEVHGGIGRLKWLRGGEDFLWADEGCWNEELGRMVQPLYFGDGVF